MPQYPAAIDLQFLTPSTGLVFRSGQSADWFGLAVSSAGDVNGDGVTDFPVLREHDTGLHPSTETRSNKGHGGFAFLRASCGLAEFRLELNRRFIAER